MNRFDDKTNRNPARDTGRCRKAWKNNKTTRVNKILSKLCCCLIAVIFLTASCKKEVLPPEISTGDGSMTIRMQLPRINNISTYGITSHDENRIDQIDVLIFAVKNGQQQYYSRVKVDDIADGSADGKSKTFAFNYPLALRDSVCLVFLANSRQYVDAAAGSLISGNLKASVLSEIQFDYLDKWPAASSGTFKPFPMWGESVCYVTDSIPSTISVSLMRALARVDVGLNFSGEIPVQLPDFKLQKVYVYNYSHKGSVSPAAENVSGTRVLAPSLPVNGDGNHTVMEYVVSPPGAPSLTHEIYLAEAKSFNPSGPNGTEGACLIIEGAYKGNEPMFYRIDFKDTTGRYLPLLRNFRYKINIKKVSGPGSLTLQEALKITSAGAGNITADLILEDDGISDIDFNDQHMLGVDKSELGLNDELSHLNQVAVFTNCPGGWIASVPSAYSSWLTVNTDNQTISGEANVRGSLPFSVTQNPGNTARTGYIHLYGLSNEGNDIIFKKVTVTQTPRELRKLRVVSTRSDYYSALTPDASDAFYTDQIGALGDHMMDSTLFGPSGDFKTGKYVAENMKGSPIPSDADIYVQNYPEDYGTLTPSGTSQGQAVMRWLKADSRRVLIVMLPLNQDRQINALGLNADYIAESFGTPASVPSVPDTSAKAGKIMNYLMKTGPFTSGAAGAVSPNVKFYSDDAINGGLTKFPSTMQVIFYKAGTSSGTEVMMGIDPVSRIIFIGNEEVFSNEKDEAQQNDYSTRYSDVSKFMNNLIAWITSVCIYGDEFTRQFY